jgi:hypothetical protein
MRKRCFHPVATGWAASDQRHGDAVKRFGDARQSNPIFGNGEEQFGLHR